MVALIIRSVGISNGLLRLVQVPQPLDGLLFFIINDRLIAPIVERSVAAAMSCPVHCLHVSLHVFTGFLVPD